jgi:hypothetical protein
MLLPWGARYSGRRCFTAPIPAQRRRLPVNFIEENSLDQHTERKLVDEFNNRVASGATRFMFYRESASWLPDAANVPVADLNRIRW